MMRRTNHIIFLIIAATVSAGLVGNFSQAEAIAYQNPEKTVYVCPPCGCGIDDREFNEPGSCSACGMGLVKKGSEDARPAPQRSQAQRKKVVILIFDGVQIIDYTGPYEVFGQAGFEVFAVATGPDAITTSMGMKVIPNYTLEDCPKPDILVIPGGGVTNTQNDPKVIKWIQDDSKDAEHILSVCNGAFILAKTGLLDGLSATTFYDLIDGLAALAPKVKVVSDKRFVDNGKIITTAGISSGIDGSLYVVSKMFGNARAQMVALNMEYNWQPDSEYARASFADRHLRRIFSRNLQRFEVPAGTTLRVLSTEGTTDAWEINWQVQGETSPADVMKLVNERLATHGKWTRKDKQTGGEATSAWNFTDEKGGGWDGMATVKPDAAEKNGFTVTIKIVRNKEAVSPSASMSKANGDTISSNKIVIKDAWVQETPPSGRTTAAYMVIENHTDSEVALVSGRTEIAGAVELHKIETENSMMRMRRIDRILIPANGKTELTGNLHIMLIGLNSDMRSGEQISLTLEFSNSVEKTIVVPIRRRGSVSL